MAALLFYGFAYGIAYYYGGVELVILLASIIGLTLFYSRISARRVFSETSLAARQQHERDGLTHIYYELAGITCHESEACHECVWARIHQLRERGARNFQTIVGNHNS